MEPRHGHGPKLVADVAVLDDGGVWLVRYRDANRYDHQAGWFLPDDLIHHAEDPADAASRILREQLGLTGTAPRLDHVESFTGRDRSWHLVFHYALVLDRAPAAEPSIDVAEARRFRLDALPPRGEVAHGGWALDTIRRLAVPSPLAAAGRDRR